MGKTFQLEIITPNDPFYKGSAESVILPAIDGEYGVLAGPLSQPLSQGQPVI